MSDSIVMRQKSGPGLLIRAVWFIFIGWWLTGIVSAIAWLAMITLIGLPLGAWLLNRIPTVITLRPRTTEIRASIIDGTTFIEARGRPQQAWYIRLIWFVLIGWWLSALWMIVGYVLVVLIITLPFGLIMYNRVPFIATLYRY